MAALHPKPMLDGCLSLARLAKRQGERAGRFGSRPEHNPFDPESGPGRAWEIGRAASIDQRETHDLFELLAPKRRALG